MIYLKVPSLPPSSNHAYANIRGTNKRVLTKVGRAYKVETCAHLAQKYRAELQFFRPDQPYLLVVRFWFLQIHNAGWPKKADSRYKRLDASNRLKLLEDALKDAAGVDDSQNLTLVLQKYEGLEEKTEIWVWNLDDEGTPFDGALASL